tara:strand:+ start:778 stop:924 length:147 start_codon:yes stop_codon:yes gene_type:complete
MKVLHLASFSGNIGDNASHYGLYKILDELIKISEIKRMYGSSLRRYKR